MMIQPQTVIPAKAGIASGKRAAIHLAAPACAGATESFA
jgi:hypothetical protein